MPAVAAAGVLVVVVVAGTSGGSEGGATPEPPPVSSAVGTDVPPVGETGLTVPASSMPVISVGTTEVPIQKTQLAAPITKGAYGEEVIRLQTRLKELGFDPGPIDGAFGAGTQQAVWAYKKLVMGVPRETLRNSDNATQVTPQMWLDMQEPITVQPRRQQGPGVTHVEIYLPQQVMAVFTDDKPTLIAHISSGDDQTWCELVSYDTNERGEPLEERVERDECGVSYTPGGVFKFTRRYEGNRQSPLGGMFNPVYFNYGIAVHGAQNVPLYPASHGCIRINHALSETFPSLVKNGNRVYVWGQDGKEPEYYSEKERLPRFNYRNPNSTSTTSSSTTTSTVAPATTATPATSVTNPPTVTTSPPATAPPTTPAPATTVPQTTAPPVTNPPTTPAPPGP